MFKVTIKHCTYSNHP